MLRAASRKPSTPTKAIARRRVILLLNVLIGVLVTAELRWRGGVQGARLLEALINVVEHRRASKTPSSKAPNRLLPEMGVTLLTVSV